MYIARSTCPRLISNPAIHPAEWSVCPTIPALRATSMACSAAAGASFMRPTHTSASDLNVRARRRGSIDALALAAWIARSAASRPAAKWPLKLLSSAWARPGRLTLCLNYLWRLPRELGRCRTGRPLSKSGCGDNGTSERSAVRARAVVTWLLPQGPSRSAVHSPTSRPRGRSGGAASNAMRRRNATAREPNIRTPVCGLAPLSGVAVQAMQGQTTAQAPTGRLTQTALR